MSTATTNPTSHPKRKSRKAEAPLAQSSARAGRQRGRRAVRLVIQATGPDDAALHSVVQGWLVPLLIEQFFAERGMEVPQPRNRSAFLKPVYQTPVQGARAEKHVDTSL